MGGGGKTPPAFSLMIIRLLEDLPGLGQAGDRLEVDQDMAIRLALARKARPVRLTTWDRREKALARPRPE